MVIMPATVLKIQLKDMLLKTPPKIHVLIQPIPTCSHPSYRLQQMSLKSDKQMVSEGPKSMKEGDAQCVSAFALPQYGYRPCKYLSKAFSKLY